MVESRGTTRNEDGIEKVQWLFKHVDQFSKNLSHFIIFLYLL